jgi:catechol 2,3-dioxygenase-like lactoylglutathione lyase family enzyme
MVIGGASFLTKEQDARPIGTRQQGRATMSLSLNHVHLKTSDPAATMRYYVENFGATVKMETANGGYQLDLHGLQLNVTNLNTDQTHQQHYGIEHMAVNTTDYSGTLAKLRANGVTVLEELPRPAGRRVCFLQAPDGAHMELIEKS